MAGMCLRELGDRDRRRLLPRNHGRRAGLDRLDVARLPRRSPSAPGRASGDSTCWVDAPVVSRVRYPPFSGLVLSSGSFIQHVGRSIHRGDLPVRHGASRFRRRPQTDCSIVSVSLHLSPALAAGGSTGTEAPASAGPGRSQYCSARTSGADLVPFHRRYSHGNTRPWRPGSSNPAPMISRSLCPRESGNPG